jgi:hypothetical protein
MPIETIDQSGKLVKGYFYSLRADFSRRRSGDEADDWIFSSSEYEDSFAYCDGANWRSEKERFECSLNKEHKTDSEPVDVTVDLCGGGTIGGFVPDMSVALVNEQVAESINESGLKQAHASLVPIGTNQTPAKDPRVYHLHLSGRNPRRPHRIEPESANNCPYCGYGPLLCTVCGVGSAVCRKCKKRCIVSRDKWRGEKDPRIVIDDRPNIEQIIEVNRWDGSDLCGGWLRGIITRRALDLLLSIHAAPFRAVPLAADISDITAEKREWLEEAKVLPNTR